MVSIETVSTVHMWNGARTLHQQGVSNRITQSTLTQQLYDKCSIISLKCKSMKFHALNPQLKSISFVSFCIYCNFCPF